MRGRWFLMVVVLSGGLACFTGWRQAHQRMVQRQQLVDHAANRLRPGWGRDQVRSVLAELRRSYPGMTLQVYSQKGAENWSVDTPIEFGANNRLLELEFDGSGFLQHRRVRDADSRAVLPLGAPTDW